MPSYQLIYHYRTKEKPFLAPGVDRADPDNWDGQQVFYFDTDEEVGQVYDEEGNPTKTPERLTQEIKDIQRELFRVTGHSATTVDSIKKVTWGDDNAPE